MRQIISLTENRFMMLTTSILNLIWCLTTK